MALRYDRMQRWPKMSYTPESFGRPYFTPPVHVTWTCAACPSVHHHHGSVNAGQDRESWVDTSADGPVHVLVALTDAEQAARLLASSRVAVKLPASTHAGAVTNAENVLAVHVWVFPDWEQSPPVCVSTTMPQLTASVPHPCVAPACACRPP